MSYAPSAQSDRALKPCDVCNGEACIVIPGMASAQHLCLHHYYTTGAHRRRPSAAAPSRKNRSSLFVERARMERQLPEAQSRFAEAFVALQRDIGEEAERAFRSASAADDPLASLLTSTAPAASARATTPRAFRTQARKGGRAASRQKTVNYDAEGGFLREAVLPERLRRLTHPKQLDGLASAFDNSRKRPMSKPTSGGVKATNPGQQKKKPFMNVWNQILDEDNSNGRTKTKTKTKWEDVEKDMIDDITAEGGVSSKTCPACGSSNVDIMNADISNRSNDSTKGEVWGSKDRAETVVEKCHCMNCGKTWNDE